jgi:uncharacterized protein (TIRG00374 family)|tara:strand:+ start:4828 stop:5808 length:981 start_codon:yes stop_codon:yes gene_type:complete
MNWKKALFYIVFLGIGIVLIYKLIDNVEDKAKLVDDMKSAPWWAIAITFSMGLLAVVSRGLRWLLLLFPIGYKPSKINSIAAVSFGYLANTLIPRSGEVVRCTALHSTDDIPVDKLFGTVITERAVDFIMLFVFLSIALVTNYTAVISLFPQMSFPDSSTLFLLFLAVVVAFTGVVVIMRRGKRSKNSLLVKLSNFINGIGVGVKSVLKMEKRIEFILHTLFIWVMYFLMSFTLFKAMEGVSSISLFEGVWVMVCGGFGMVFPASGGIGAYQFAVQQGFISLGFSASIGLAVANVVWLTQTLMLVSSGAVGYLFIHRARTRNAVQK